MNKLFGTLLLVLIFSCSHAPVLTPEKKQEIVVPMSPHLFAVSWFQNSGEAKALFYQGYTLATEKLKNQIKFRQKKYRRLAVVLDIDETVLDNSPYNAGLILREESYPKGWKEWCEAAKAKALPGVKNFLSFAESKNVEIFYISNRDENYLEATVKNLQAEGLPVKKKNLFLKSKTSNKEEKRKIITEKFRIALLLGDNLNDFSDIFEKQDDAKRKKHVEDLASEFGTKFIILPNPMYGDWEGGIYQYNWKLPFEEKMKMHTDKLESF